jgi:hypothetical protein
MCHFDPLNRPCGREKFYGRALIGKAQRRKIMAIKKVEAEKAPNEFDFEKVKGFGAYNFVWHNTKVLVEDTGLSVTHTRKIMFSKGKPDKAVVNLSDLDHVEWKGHFSKGDFISGIIIAVISIVTLQIYGLLVTAFLVFFSYGKNIVIVRKDGSKVIIQCGGPLSGGGKAEFERMIPMLTTKTGRQVYAAPVKA